MKIGELSRHSLELRKKFWQEELGLDLQWQDVTEEQLGNPLLFLKNQGWDGLLLDPEFSDLLIVNSPRVPAEVVEVGFADSLIRENDKIWLRCFVREALRLLILRKATKLDTHATCYVTGASSLARMCAVVAIQMGYGHLVMITTDADDGSQLVENLKKLFFGLDLRTLPKSELTMQPNNGSLLINTVTREQDESILEDLTYLNFLKKDGLVVDVPLSFESNSLMEEAAHVGVRSLSSLELWSFRDYLFLKSVSRDALSVTAEEYFTKWKSFAAPENET